jgi:quinol monooxygenase YgiN
MKAGAGAEHMEIFIFARFQARPGEGSAVERALREVVVATREEDGCLGIHAFRALRDPQVFYIHSQWKDEAAFETHARLAHTVKFVECVGPLLDHPVEAQRCEKLA